MPDELDKILPQPPWKALPSSSNMAKKLSVPTIDANPSRATCSASEKSSYLVLKKTHLVPIGRDFPEAIASNQFEERLSGFSGLPILVDKNCKRQRAPQLHDGHIHESEGAFAAQHRVKNAAHSYQVYQSKLLGSLRRDYHRQNESRGYASFLRDRRYQRTAARRAAWRDASHRKWQALQFLHNLRSSPEHRFAPPLDVAFSKAMPRYHVNSASLRNAYVDNFALDREQRQQVMEALELCFLAMDEDADTLVDWREFLCHLEVVYLPRRSLRERLSAMFRCLTDHRQLLTLDRLWAMLCTFALPHQREFLASQAWPLFCTLSPQTHGVIVSDETDACRLLDFLRVAQVRRYGDFKEDPLDDKVHGGGHGLMLSFHTGPSQEETRWIRAAVQVELTEDDVVRNIVANYEHRTLQTLLSKLAWDRLSPEIRVRVRAERVEETHDAFEKINLKIRWMEARNFWNRVVRPNTLQMRFDRWKAVAISRIRLKQGAAFYMFRRKQIGLRSLELFAERKKFDRWRNSMADRFAARVLFTQSMHLWKEAHEREKRFQIVQVRKAKRLYSTWQLERILHGWRREAHLRRQFRRLRTIWHRRLERRVYETWRDNVRTIVDKRKFEEERSLMRQQILSKELEEVEHQIAEARRREAEEEQALQDALDQERQAALEEEMRWERERERAFAGYERRTILRRQEENRANYKADILAREEKDIEDAFATVMEKAIQDAKREAETFARTRDGKEQLEREAEKIQNDADRLARKDGTEDTANEEGAEWKKMFDPVFQTYFFYNPETGEKVTASSLSMKEAMSIARTNYVASIVQVAKDEVERLKQQEIDKKRLIWAGRKVQAAWRVRKARMAVHELIKSVYMKRVDPYTGKMYYYNTQSRKSSWTKPLNLGPRKDLRVPEWVVRCDADGQWSYQNNVTPWTSSSTKPPGFLQCLTCNLQLAIIRCDTCAKHFCLDCFEAAHPRPVDHTIVRKPYARLVKDSPEMCVMCKKEIASKFCIECGLVDFYCRRCYNMSHAKNPNRPHQLSAKQKHEPAIDF